MRADGGQALLSEVLEAVSGPLLISGQAGQRLSATFNLAAISYAQHNLTHARHYAGQGQTLAAQLGMQEWDALHQLTPVRVAWAEVDPARARAPLAEVAGLAQRGRQPAVGAIIAALLRYIAFKMGRAAPKTDGPPHPPPTPRTPP